VQQESLEEKHLMSRAYSREIKDGTFLHIFPLCPDVQPSGFREEISHPSTLRMV